MRRILSIDGGGIKGVVPAAFLDAIESDTGKRIVDHFDLIAGTSTGGIIALGLGLGLTAKDILKLYLEQGPRIFDQEFSTGTVGRFRDQAMHWRRRLRHLFKPKYTANALGDALHQSFGNRLLGDSRTRLLIPAFNASRREVHVFKTSHHERFTTDWKVSAVDVGLSTAAAPSYFPSWTTGEGVGLIDGGVWANNPTGLAVVEALGVLNWPSDEIYVLSLGCCEDALKIPDSAGGARFLLCAIDLLMLGQSRAANGTAKLLTGHTESNRRLYRYNQIVPPSTFDLDSVGAIAALRGVGVSQAREAIPQLTNVFFRDRRQAFKPHYGGDFPS